MPAQLDDLLHQLPTETMPVDLPAKIRLRLRAQRSRESRVRMALDAGMAVLLACGLIVLVPQLVGAIGSLRGGSLESSMTWVNQLGNAPAAAVWDALAGGLDWTRGLAGNLGVDGLLGLVLLSLPLFVWLRRLMPERGPTSDAAAGWSGPNLKEGVAA
jgi:hypothetical protein